MWERVLAGVGFRHRKDIKGTVASFGDNGNKHGLTLLTAHIHHVLEERRKTLGTGKQAAIN